MESPFVADFQPCRTESCRQRGGGCLPDVRWQFFSYLDSALLGIVALLCDNSGCRT